jgi:hypothetical protein
MPTNTPSVGRTGRNDNIVYISGCHYRSFTVGLEYRRHMVVPMWRRIGSDGLDPFDVAPIVCASADLFNGNVNLSEAARTGLHRASLTQVGPVSQVTHKRVTLNSYMLIELH